MWGLLGVVFSAVLMAVAVLFDSNMGFIVSCLIMTFCGLFYFGK
jgi:hypothetical protein